MGAKKERHRGDGWIWSERSGADACHRSGGLEGHGWGEDGHICCIFSTLPSSNRLLHFFYFCWISLVDGAFVHRLAWGCRGWLPKLWRTEVGAGLPRSCSYEFSLQKWRPNILRLVFLIFIVSDYIPSAFPMQGFRQAKG